MQKKFYAKSQIFKSFNALERLENNESIREIQIRVSKCWESTMESVAMAERVERIQWQCWRKTVDSVQHRKVL